MVRLIDPRWCGGKSCTQNRPAPKGVIGGQMCGCPCHHGGECMSDIKARLGGLMVSKERKSNA